MPAVKKIKEKDAGARRRLLDATAQIMRDEGRRRPGCRGTGHRAVRVGEVRLRLQRIDRRRSSIRPTRRRRSRDDRKSDNAGRTDQNVAPPDRPMGNGRGALHSHILPSGLRAATRLPCWPAPFCDYGGFSWRIVDA
jgi:hypothetical protein